MSRMSIKNGKVNVDRMVRKIIGVEPAEAVPFNKLDLEEKHAYWTVANVFRRTGTSHLDSRGTGYKTGLGMKMIEDFVNTYA